MSVHATHAVNLMTMLVLLLSAAPCRHGFAGSAGGEEQKLASGTSYHCWLPAKFDPDARYLLVVACHGVGANGTSMDPLARALHGRNLPVIVVAPTFPWNGPAACTIDAAMSQKSMAVAKEVLEDAKNKWLVYPRIGLFGFSCGAWFTHEFTQRQTGEVLACAALSSPGTIGLRPAAKEIPFLIAAGTKDEYFEKTKQLYESMRSAGYTDVTCDWQEGVGATLTAKMLGLAADLLARAYEDGPGSCVQVGRVRFWFPEATALEEVNAAAFSTALQRLRAGAKDGKIPEHATEAERLLKAVEQWNGKRMARIEQLIKTSPARGVELLRQTLVLLKGDPLAEPFAKREAEAAKDRELQKQLALDRQFEGMAAIYRKEAGRFRRAEDPKAVALRQQFEVALDAFIKANANTVAADRAADMKKELSAFCTKPQAPR